MQGRRRISGVAVSPIRDVTRGSALEYEADGVTTIPREFDDRPKERSVFLA